MVYTCDSKSHAARLMGSSPISSTLYVNHTLQIDMNILEQHSSEWRSKFEIESQLIRGVFGTSLLDIQHIGSTAIADLLAKPIVDIAVQIASHQQADLFIHPLSLEGYHYKPELSSGERHFFQKGDPVAVHLSVAYLDRGGYWQRQILFRDYLSAHPEARREYENVKRSGVPKDEFVQRILALAASRQ